MRIKNKQLKLQGFNQCSKCGEIKLAECFAVNKKWNCLENVCKSCRHYLQNIARRKRMFNVTQDGYQEMFLNQNKSCAICERNDLILNLDHNHLTGKIRQLLCTPCNTILGKLQLDYGFDHFNKFKDYIIKHETSQL